MSPAESPTENPAERTAPAAASDAPAVDAIRGWHAHIYYDPDRSRGRAEKLRAKIARDFPDALIGRWHDSLVGPHTRAMFQVAFAAPLFARFVPWLALNRDGLAVLVHPNSTGDHAADHTAHVIWMGEILPVNLKAFR